jgi:hypothetical protein
VSHPSVLKVNIFQADMGDSTLFLGNNGKTYRWIFTTTVLFFRFTAINLKGSRNIKYQYILTGHEKQWQTGTDIREARYSSLPPGTYVFRVKASIDGLRLDRLQ